MILNRITGIFNLKSAKMANYIINGGKPLTGSIKTKSAKNAAVSILCATAMIRGKTTLVDVPEIEEVKRIMEILNSIGSKVFWSGKNKLTVENQNHVNLKNIDRKATKLTRSSFLIVGALANKLKKFTMYKPGGCELGIRTLNPHIIAFAHLGIEIKESKNLLSDIEENKSLDLGFKVFKLSSSNFKIWRGNEITEDNLETQLDAFTNPVREGSEKENMLYELILKAGYLLTDKVQYVIANEAKQSSEHRGLLRHLRSSQ